MELLLHVDEGVVPSTPIFWRVGVPVSELKSTVICRAGLEDSGVNPLHSINTSSTTNTPRKDVCCPSQIVAMPRIWSLLFISFVGASSRPNVWCWARGALADRCVAKDVVPLLTDEIDVTQSSSEATIQKYLKSNVSPSGKFHVQGWRWHTLSLVRDARRLGNLAQRLADSINDTPSDSQAPQVGDDHQQQSPLLQAVEFVVGFNMKGLHRVEAELFIPWMRKTVQTIDDRPIVDAFTELLNGLDQDRTMVAQLGNALREKAIRISSYSTDDARREALQSIEKDALRIAECTREMFRLQDSLLVPTVARLVPEAEQKSFNNKVLRTLGILDSRTHIVGMYDTVLELKDEIEHQLFQEVIPYLPRLMIPRWKRLLYQPRAGVLDDFQSA